MAGMPPHPASMMPPGAMPPGVMGMPPHPANMYGATAAAAPPPLAASAAGGAAYPLKDIHYPHPHDVLCGRGGATNQHIGNSHWRQLVAANKELYLKLPKRQKQLLSKSIVHAVRSQQPPGRFLQKHPQTDLWYDVGDARALEKTSQALREGAPKLKKKLETTTGGTAMMDPKAAAAAEIQEVLPAVHIPPPPRSSKNTTSSTTTATASATTTTIPTTIPPMQAQTSRVESLGGVSTGQTSVHSNTTQLQDNTSPAFATTGGGGGPPPILPPTILPQGPVPERKGKKSKSTTLGQQQPQQQVQVQPPPPSFHDDYFAQHQMQQQMQQHQQQQQQEQQQQNQNNFADPSSQQQPNMNNHHQYDDDDDAAIAPPNLADPDGYRDCSLGLVSVPDPVDGGLTENGGFSFGTVMSVESAYAKVQSAVDNPDHELLLSDQELALLAADNAHKFQTHVQQYEQQNHTHNNSNINNSNINSNNTVPPAVQVGQVVFDKEQQQQQQGGGGDDNMPTPVDMGLEPAGLSTGSMMSFGSLMPGKLDNGGLSFGSIMSYTTMPSSSSQHNTAAPLPVDGGLEEIGASFGSMTIATNPPPARPQHEEGGGAGESGPAAPQWGAPMFPPSHSQNNNKGNKKSENKANLLECSDTESEDEQDQQRLQAQKSADWMKFKATFEQEMQGGRAAPTFLTQSTTKASYGTSATPNTARIRNLSTTVKTNGGESVPPQAGDMLHIPTTNFGRNISAMSAGEDDDFGDNDQYQPQQQQHQGQSDYVLPPQGTPAAAAAPGDDGMPPPPPPQLQKLGDDPAEEWAAYDMLNRGNSQDFQGRDDPAEEWAAYDMLNRGNSQDFQGRDDPAEEWA
eukprot:CAMPEP_0168752902 /NCGR_PEP_ID=MMETSP0724-20121128/18645_1 /TAXON_ID=265536 /ORGANISM="Amphiprora sp., Strain CCMP467" /LENGTH=851 /DNA_ID=CAMNT_0008801205 /DNA_START=13 /DNA_END=2565 /DNA_ORIENTATION=+